LKEYLTGLANKDVELLAQAINPDDLSHDDALREAQRQLDFYGSRFDLSSLKESGAIMYDDYRQNFQQVILDGSDNGFLLAFRCSDGLASIEPPEMQALKTRAEAEKNCQHCINTSNLPNPLRRGWICITLTPPPQQMRCETLLPCLRQRQLRKSRRAPAFSQRVPVASFLPCERVAFYDSKVFARLLL
jgi:hypothetical protein